MTELVVLTGEDLTLAEVWEVALHGRQAALADSARDSMTAARELVDGVHGEHTYGVNTGFGRFVSAHIPEELAEELQLRLLRSHACGVGEPYPDEVVRAAMLLRANALAKGFSGAHVSTVELLIECLNRGVLPQVPARGSVGASGDLAPLAHLALPLVGEGSASVDGELLSGGDALRAVGLEPIRLASKEGLSLVNGTQFMAAMAALGAVRARRLAATADLACALSLEALQGSRTSFLAAVHAARPLRGQQDSAANVWRLLEGSAILESHRWCDRVQDAYSLRCAPQVHGASRDLLDHVAATVAVGLLLYAYKVRRSIDLLRRLGHDPIEVLHERVHRDRGAIDVGLPRIAPDRPRGRQPPQASPEPQPAEHEDRRGHAERHRHDERHRVPRRVVFAPGAWDDYRYWHVTDARLFERLNRLIDECRRDPFRGTGKPEPLKGNLSGFWSRRLSDSQRLVYRVHGNDLEIAACRYHYGE